MLDLCAAVAVHTGNVPVSLAKFANNDPASKTVDAAVDGRRQE